MRLLVTGGCGFLGSNLVENASKNGYEVVVFDNLSRFGSEKNKIWLSSLPNVNFFYGDIRNLNDIDRCLRLVRPDLIFHLAGQVAMTTSLDNPLLDFETNVLGTINLLESVRLLKLNPIIIYSSTNKVYGDLESLVTEEVKTRYTLPDFPNGIDETTPLDFRSPYGCSKGSADQYMLDYYRNYGIRTIVFRHSSIFGGRQFSTFDQGWVGWFIRCAIETEKTPEHTFTISGNGKQVRDILFSQDIVSCYFMAAKNIKKYGEAFNIGGGERNSLSLLELFNYLEERLSINLNYKKLPPRSSDQKVFVANTKKAQELFGWNAAVSRDDGLDLMVDWVKSNVN
jgi:CDP-paratose 2-epimerase